MADLDGHRGIFYTNRGAGDWRFSGSNGATIVRGRAALLVNNGDMMRDAALAGLGIALLPMLLRAPTQRLAACKWSTLECSRKRNSFMWPTRRVGGRLLS